MEACLVVLEAMYFKVPWWPANIGGIQEIIRHGKMVYWLNPRMSHIGCHQHFDSGSGNWPFA